MPKRSTRSRPPTGTASTTSTPAPSVSASPPPALAALGAARGAALASLGARTLRDVLALPSLGAARTLMAVARDQLPGESAVGLLRDPVAATNPAALVAMPLASVAGVDAQEVRTLAALGITTLAEAASLAQVVEEAIAAASADNGFSERPSAPSELLPTVLGAVASDVRLGSFVRDTELRGLRYFQSDDCRVDLPLSSRDGKRVGLDEIFSGLRCAVTHLGYLATHQQRWINLGTQLGEVMHTVALAPGESRNIALVNFRRQQTTQARQDAETGETLSSGFVQNRALQEVASAVALEHLVGGTRTEADTASTAVGLAGSAAVGIGVGLAGSALGAGIGTLAAPGIGSVIGAAAGGAIAGVAAAGFVSSGASTLGRIETDTTGTREILADLQQRISLSTRQKSSSVRSLWATSVVEDTQAEQVEGTTSNITNYNHMHSLNITYYEMLQHYLVRTDVTHLQPLLFLPFTFLDFSSLRFIRDYWDAVRPHIEDEGLQSGGDIYFVDDTIPDAPDLLPVPPPVSVDGGSIVGLRLMLSFTHDHPVDFSVSVVAGGEEIAGTEANDPRVAGDVRTRTFNFPTIRPAAGVTAVRVRAIRSDTGRFGVGIRAVGGNVRVEGSTTGLRFTDIGSARFSGSSNAASVPWAPPGIPAGLRFDLTRQRLQQAKIDRAEMENARRIAAHAALVANRDRFLRRLEAVVLRRRHFFTRVILEAIEPEEIIQLMEALRITHPSLRNTFAGIPLGLLANTTPIAVTPGAFVLELKRLDAASVVRIGQAFGIDGPLPELQSLFGYADQTLTAFEQRREALARTDNVHIPTGGLFAEAILGRANSAEFLDLERYFQWTDAPIPHQAPPIAAVDTGSRFQRGEVPLAIPEGQLQVINPVALPDPATGAGALAALAQAGLFRDASGAEQIASVISSLTTLAGSLGTAASTLTGSAAQQALQAATQLSQTAATMAQGFACQKAAGKPGGSTTSEKGAALNQQKKQDEAAAAAGTPSSGKNAEKITLSAAGLGACGDG